MKFKCLGTGSSGNCYLLEDENECLVLEAGLPFMEVKKALDFEVGKIVGVVISHSHNDHYGYVKEYIKSGIEVYASEQTHEKSKDSIFKKVVRCGYWYKLGNFTITPFECVHDVECFGFIIRHDKIGTMLFATDTMYIKQNFKSLKLNHIMVECNYDEDIVDSRLTHEELVRGLRDRVLQTHMNYQTCKGFISANMTSSLYNVCLLHLSDGNSHEQRFREGIKEIVGRGTEVLVADKGMEIVVDLFPF